LAARRRHGGIIVGLVMGRMGIRQRRRRFLSG